MSSARPSRGHTAARTFALLGALAALTQVGVAAAQSRSDSERRSIPLGLDLYRPVPPDNPLTAAKVALGRSLFFDPILSRDSALACAGCHEPARAFTDGRARSVGVGGVVGRRSAPSLVNRVYGRFFFWDGRETSLEAQVLRPIQDAAEMDMTLAEALTRLEASQEYRQLFEDVFTRPPNAENLAASLASYVRTILAGDSPVDRYYSGDPAALSPEAREGLRVFRGKANCGACHIGPNFTDEKFHNTGVAWGGGRLLDPGRFFVTEVDSDRGAFKTPTLREVAQTAPYMHDGAFSTLEEVVDFYDRGGNSNPYLDPILRPLNLSADERAALVAFLRLLSGEILEG